MAVLTTKQGTKLYPVGAFNRLDPIFEKFRNRYFGNVIPQDERNSQYIDAMNHVHITNGMIYAEYKYYRILKNLI